MGKFKALITEAKIMIERKFQNPVQERNLLSVIMATNEQHAIDATPDDRRNFVLKLSNRRANDTTYFAALDDQMQNGGCAAMLHYLLNLTLSAYCTEHGINLRKPPMTGGKCEQILATLRDTDPKLHWWHTCLDRGFIYRWSRDHHREDTKPWPPFLAKNLFIESYDQYVRSQKVRRPAAEYEVYRMIKKFASGEVRKSSVTSGESNLDDPKIVERARCYELPELSVAREEFEAQLGTKIDWSTLQ